MTRLLSVCVLAAAVVLVREAGARVEAARTCLRLAETARVHAERIRADARALAQEHTLS